MMVTFNKCRLCDSKALLVIKKYQVNRRHSPNWQEVIKNLKLRTPITIRLAVCRKCGFLFYKDTLTFEEMGQLYRREARYSRPKTHQLKAGRLWEQDRMVSFLSSNLPKNEIKTVLDVGSGDFVTLERIVAVHPSASYTALDPSYPNPIHNKIPVFQTMVETWKVRNQYDLVTLIHVLEHIGDLTTFMKKIRQLSKRGRYIYVEVPFQVGPGLLLNRAASVQHVNYFTPYSIMMLLKHYGFDAVQLEFDRSAYPHNGMPGMIRVLAKNCLSEVHIENSFWGTMAYLFSPLFILRSQLKLK